MNRSYLDLSQWVPCTKEDFDGMAALCADDEIRHSEEMGETALFLNNHKIAVTLVDNADFRRFYVRV